jgi:hypothetical protein
MAARRLHRPSCAVAEAGQAQCLDVRVRPGVGTLPVTGEWRGNIGALTVREGLPVMTISSISSTQSPSVSGVVAARYTHHKKELSGSTATALLAPVTPSTADVNPMASAIAGALTQLGLTSAPRAAGSDDTTATGNAPLASLPQQPKAAQQVQQYKNNASTFSNLAQALNASSSSASSNASGTGNLTTVFQNLWTSLNSSSGTSSGTSTESSDSGMPSLPLFLQTLARNFSESGVSGLRGVFVDTTA